MSLREKIPTILNHIRVMYENQVVYNHKVIEVWKGQLKKHVEEAMQKELSPESYIRSKGRIPPINVLQQFTKKTNRTYSEPAKRTVISDNDLDEETLKEVEECLNLDNEFKKVGEYQTLNKASIVEIANQDRKVKVRTIPANQFLLWSDDGFDPANPTVVIKFMGSKQKITMQTTDINGNTLKSATQVVREVHIYHIFDAESMVEVDSDGAITLEVANEYGELPFIINRENEDELQQTPDSDMFQMAVLIPLMLTDLNYALQFCTHSIIYGIDLDTSGLTFAPDTLWNLKSQDTGDAKKTPTIGTIKPEVDSDKAMSSIQAQMTMWLESKGLKVGSVGQGPANISGIGKMIDEADATAIRKDKVVFMSNFEKKFWALYIRMTDMWAKQGRLPDGWIPFSKDCEIATQFSEQQPIQDFKSTLDELKIMFELGLTTVKQALQKLYPNKSEEEIDDILEDIAEDKAEAMAMAMQVAQGTALDENGVPMSTEISNDNTNAQKNADPSQDPTKEKPMNKVDKVQKSKTIVNGNKDGKSK